jgi:uncharacterized surface protein with fasciclin (FAS1) repeats
MKIPAALTAAALSAALVVSAAPAAQAEAGSLGQRSLAKVLAADGNKFDRNWQDFDIVDRAVLTVLKAKPDSPVAVLADGSKKLTAFIPTDRAFRRLVKDVTGKRLNREKAVFNVVKSLGVDTVEAVLLYHVVPGARITAAKALQADGAKLKTALGPRIKVNVEHGSIRLIDKDRNDLNPEVIIVNINKRNKQIAHGINRVLRPVDL